MESFHGETVSGWGGSYPTARQREDGEGAISRRDSERIIRESSHRDGASERQMAMDSFHGETVNRWRGSHLTARQRADSEGVCTRRYRECPADSEDSCAHNPQNL